MDNRDFRDQIYRMERKLNAIARATRAYFRQQRHTGKRNFRHQRRKVRAAEIRAKLHSLWLNLFHSDVRLDIGASIRT
jgi:hypothetical protein